MFRLLLIGLVFLSFFGCSNDQPKPAQIDRRSTQPPLPMTTSAIPSFSGKDAFALLLRQTSFGPRNPGSQGHRSCLEYLGSTLRELADRVTFQDFNHQGYDHEQLHLTNVIASFRPEMTSRILLCAHWDTR